MRKVILFVTYGEFSSINKNVIESFEKAFSDNQLIRFDILNEIIKKGTLFFKAKLFASACINYPRLVLFNPIGLKKKITATGFFFRVINRVISKQVKNGAYGDVIFTFQMQSHFSAKVDGIPNYIFTDHAHLTNLQYVDFDKKSMKSKAWIKEESELYITAEKIFCMSTHVATTLRKQYGIPSIKISVVGAGPNMETSEENNPSKYESKNILFVGVDWERKGGPELLLAFIKAKEYFPSARLTIVGCTPGIGREDVNEVGRVPLKNVTRYYNEAQIFCLPTKREPFGIVFLEAMLNELPIIASNLGALPDFIDNGSNGYLVTANSVTELSEALISLLGSPNVCSSMGKLNAKKVRSYYNWKSTVSRIKNEIRG